MAMGEELKPTDSDGAGSNGHLWRWSGRQRRLLAMGKAVKATNGDGVGIKATDGDKGSGKGNWWQEVGGKCGCW